MKVKFSRMIQVLIQFESATYLSFAFMNAKNAFAERLQAAMLAAGYEQRPSILEREFNLRYWGRPITFQAASSWLTGKSVPAQEKLEVLAEWLRIEPQALRFGEAAVTRIRKKHEQWEMALKGEEREVLQAYLDLPVEQRKIIREVILAFALAGQAANH